MRRILIGGVATGVAALALFSNPAMADSTVVVGATGGDGWTFNPDPANATPYEMSTAEAKTGNGSLHVLPIVNAPLPGTGQQKFIGLLDTQDIPVPSFQGFSFDFMIENGDASDAGQFYVNVLANVSGSSTFYDCRFDYPATTGSDASFTTLAVAPTDTPVFVRDPAGGPVCPATPAGMPTGSTINFIAINVGDTTTSDEGLGGYLDNAKLTVAGNTTTYNFDVDANDDGISDTVGPTDKEQCKKGGYATFNNPSFRNQGECVSYVNRNS